MPSFTKRMNTQVVEIATQALSCTSPAQLDSMAVTDNTGTKIDVETRLKRIQGYKNVKGHLKQTTGILADKVAAHRKLLQNVETASNAALDVAEKTFEAALAALQKRQANVLDAS